MALGHAGWIRNLMENETAIERPRILIVDDDDSNHRVYERILGPLNLHIEKAHSGLKALEVAHRHDFFLILMDVQMPIMDGFETASLILEHPKTHHIPVIFVTALAKDEAFEFKGYESGAVDYLTKPINDDILKSKISIFLKLWQQRQSLQDNHLELKRLNQALTKSHGEMKWARDEAEAATQVKSEFLSNMSHELRSPLSGILSLSKKLSNNKDKNLSAGEVKSANIINSSGTELLRLIDDILDLAKVEAGMIEVEVGEFSLQALLQALVAQHSPIIDAKKSPVVLQLTISEQVPEIISTDQLRLGQIIRNLLSNAIKFTAEGSITINAQRLSGNRLAISVSDTGIGIKPENLTRIFEAFKQEDSSVTRRFGGTGLGLSISLNLVNLLGGDLRAHSQLKQGSCFTVELPFDLPTGKKNLPISAAVPKPINESQANAGLAMVASAALNNKTILLVEDSALNVDIVHTALEDYNVNIVVAENGQVALDTLAQSECPDLILMDIMMPVMDGYEAIQKIRENKQWQSLPIIVLTASKMPASKTLCLELGASDYINKPFDTDLLVAKMSELISGRLSAVREVIVGI
ncbi:MAG: response regulator [Bermanella sp.]